MKKSIPFLKMQACGNDFVLIDHLAGAPAGFGLSRELGAKISHRQFGVGCDQILWLKPAAEAAGVPTPAGAGGEGLDPSKLDAFVAILNSDGSRAEMCGNGMRAVGRYLAEHGPRPGGSRYEVAVSAGRAPIRVGIDLTGEFPEVAIGAPTVFPDLERIHFDGAVAGLRNSAPAIFKRVEIGNPHAVFFLGEENPGLPVLERMEIALVGSFVERHKLFPHRTNVEFVERESATRLVVRVWERGAGATLACGSGACAVVAAAESRGFTTAGERIEVVLPGGTVYVRLVPGWQSGTGSALLSGPAEEVFRGEWPLG